MKVGLSDGDIVLYDIWIERERAKVKVVMDVWMCRPGWRRETEADSDVLGTC